MAAKTTKLALAAGAHTAGIYSDMTVDGPEIGTLVVVIDRAKNLPNRKSMGKQDPYCAARLAKEAKKTETDKRGGQTPRWDQELRFTVRESPDYYQLKVSVFNDDKKTELIGETWISLDSILVSGGGRNDIWHNLNCKGKYAGEIRIELTYYDTRPRELRLEERRQSAQIDGMPSSGPGREGMAGPRQMKPTKRRPLPAEPTGSSPLPHTPPQSLSGTPQRLVEGQNDYVFDAARLAHSQVQHLQHSPTRGSPLNQSYNPNHMSHDNNLDMEPKYQYPSPEQFGQCGPDGDADRQENSLPLNQTLESGYYNRSFIVDPSHELPSTPLSGTYANGNHRNMTDPKENIDPRLLNQPQRLNMVHSDSSLAGFTHKDYPKATVLKQDSYDSSPPQRSLLRDSNSDAWTNLDQDVVQGDRLPPAPPTHRHTALRSALQAQDRDPYGPVPTTAPHNPRNDRRGSNPDSPLTQGQNSILSAVSPMSTSPSSRQKYPHHDSISSISSYHSPTHRRSHSPIRDSIRDREVYGDSMPPSLTPGYDPTIAADESERLIREQRMIDQQTAHGPMPRYQQAAAVPIQQPKAQPIPRGFESISNRKEHREHRYSAPIPPTAPAVRSQPFNVDTRRPIRKSVSPQPGPAGTERRHSELSAQVPFGPDSFDIYNPSIGSAGGVNDIGARYTTPEQAREARMQHEKQEKLGDGPIFGSDGRIIDPSDHLPSDTWAPEPDPKPARKGPEVTIRFKQNPQGAQHMARNVRQPLREARPNALSSPAYPQPGEDSPASASRTRLQKKVRPGMAQPNSSPMLPSFNISPRNTMPRSSASDYPPRDNQEFGSYSHSSPTYVNRLPGGIPPPIPGKVPIGSGQEDWGTDALSEEMRRIDIGIGGRGPPRRARYGTRDV